MFSNTHAGLLPVCVCVCVRVHVCVCMHVDIYV